MRRSGRPQFLFYAATLSILLCVSNLSVAQSQGYTFNADFDQGTLLNVNHSDIPDQLQLNTTTKTLPFLWIAVSSEGTTIKVDTSTGEILGEYTTSPEGMDKNPSRTTVDHYGNVWVGNRDEADGGLGSVVKYGQILGGIRGYPDVTDPTLFIEDPNGQYIADPVYNQCVDRNGDDLIQTSGGYGDVQSWPMLTDGTGSPCDASDSNAWVEDPVDECILTFQRVNGTNVRHLSVDPDNNIWIGGYTNYVFDLLDGETGCILDTKNFECGGYGGLTDCFGVVWSAHPTLGQLLRYDPITDTETCITIDYSYGLGIDSQGFIWNSQYLLDSVVKLDPSDATVLLTKPVDPNGECQGYSGSCIDNSLQGLACPTGLAVRTLDDSIWITNRYCNYQGQNYDSLSRLDSNGDLMKVVPLIDGTTSEECFTPTGAAVDGNGKIWVNCYDSSNLMRIDPDGGADGLGAVDLTIPLAPGARPYDYSDMSGLTGLSNPVFGFWDIVKGTGCEGSAWRMARWNEEPAMPQGTLHEPPGTKITVEIRVADTIVGLSRKPFMEVGNGEFFGPLPGRYIEARVNFYVERGVHCGSFATPILTDLTFMAVLPIRGYAGPDKDICIGESVTLSEAQFLAPECTGDIEYRWSWPGNTGTWSPDPIIIVTPDTETEYTVEARCSTDPDCSVEDRVVVRIHEYPTADVTAQSIICLNHPTFLDGSNSTSPACAKGLSYRYRLPTGPVVRDWSTDPYYIFTLTTTDPVTHELDVRCNDNPECLDTEPITVQAEDCTVPVRYGWYRAEATAEGGVLVQWQVLSEVDTLGYRVQQYAAPDEEEVVGMVLSRGSGSTYEVEVAPEGLADLSKVYYRVVETTATGPGDATPLFGISGAKESAGVHRSRAGREQGRSR
ncbi:hypothetical protein ACFLU6_12005 [Acidobacteriota bacterium]